MKESKLTLLRSCTLLLVDDEHELLQDLATTLGLFFRTVLMAKNGEEALHLYQTKNVDVIMTDYVMPSLDGLTLCRMIREQNPHIPMLILSSHSDEEKLLNMIPLNLTSYLLKPVSFQELTDALLKVVERLENEIMMEFTVAEGVVYDKPGRRLRTNTESIKLTQSESIMLDLFIQHPNRVVSLDMIDQEFMMMGPLSYQATKNLIYRLRKKIGKQTIRNVHSSGYIFSPPSGS